jgi:O-antigen/teichoic acid export membrane protein
MKKKFVSNLILVLLLNVVIKPFYILGIDAEILKITEQSSPGSYGTYFSLLSLTFIFNILLDMGVNTFNTKNIAQNTQLIQKHFSGIFTLKLILGFVYLLIILSIGFLFSYELKEMKWLLIIGFNQVLIALILFFRSNLSALLLFRQDSFLSVIDRLLLIFFCGYFLWANVTHQIITIDFFILSQTLAYGATAILGFILVGRKTKKFTLKWDYAFFLMIIKKSLPYALLIFLMSIYYYSDVVMIEQMKGSLEATSYAHGYRFFMAFNMLGFLFAGLLLPIFSKMIKEHIDINSITWLSFKLIFFIAVLIGGVFWFIKEDIIHWRYQLSGEDLMHSSNTFGWLLLSFIAVSCNYIFGTLLTANGRLKPMNILAITGVFINVTLNLFLINQSGSSGAAIASLITQIFTLIAQVILCYKFFPLKIKILPIFQIIGYPFIFFMGIFLLDLFFLSKEVYTWPLKLVTYTSIGIVSGFTFGFVRMKDFLSIIKISKN